MKIKLNILVFFITIFSLAQTKVDNVQFNNISKFEGVELMLNGAGSLDKLYAIALYLDFEVDEGVKVANVDKDMALTLKITSSSLNSIELKEMFRNGLERATDGNSYLIEDSIRNFLSFLPTEINKYEIFKFVYLKGGAMSIYRNREKLGSVKSLDFKKAFFKIWLGDNPVDLKLKEDLLSSNAGNQILGKWKTYDRKSGVAISIVQLYVINKMVFGAVERMLRQSERDAICYECKGEDKNKNVEGLVIIKKLRPKGDNKYDDGMYTDIKNGEISECQIWLDEDDQDVLNVKIRGVRGVDKWRRVKTPKK